MDHVDLVDHLEENPTISGRVTPTTWSRWWFRYVDHVDHRRHAGHGL